MANTFTKNTRKHFRGQSEMPAAVALSTNAYTGSLAEVIRGAFGGCAKKIAMIAGCNPRAAENWLQARNAPSGPYLIALMRESEELTAEILRLAGRSDLADVQKRAAAASKIEAALKELNS